MSDFVVKPYVKFVPAEQDVVAEAAASAAEAKTTANGAEAKIGNLSQLTTTAKSNLAEAINEAAQSGGSGGTPTTWQATLGSDDLGNTAFVVEIPEAEMEGKELHLGDLVECTVSGQLSDFEFTATITSLDSEGVGAIISHSFGGGGGTEVALQAGVYPVLISVIYNP